MLKLLLLAVCLLVPGLTHADDIQSVKNWILSQPIKAGSALDFQGHVSGISYLSVLSVGQSGWGAHDQKALEYASLNGGVEFGGGAKPLVVGMVKPHNIGAALWNASPAAIQSHAQRLELPDIELGLTSNLVKLIQLCLNQPHDKFVIGKDIKLAFAFKFGGS